MPIPTDTFWNIKRLNIVFAASGVLLVAVMLWSISQDYYQGWRTPQQNGKVWEAALVNEKLTSDFAPDKQQRLAELNQQLDEKQKDLAARQDDLNRINKELKQLASTQADVEFNNNTLKADVGVMEGALQDAQAAGDQAKARQIIDKIKQPRAKLAAFGLQLEQLKNDQADRRKLLAQRNGEFVALQKERKKLTDDADALKKKLDLLQPRGPFSFLADQIRAAPLMQFINPRERIAQIVLPDVQTDVAFMKITTIDRCTTCHVNINKKDFAEDKVIAYLEEQLATARKVKLAPAAAARPGAVAMPEFWHLWAVQLAPDLVNKQTRALTAICQTIGKDKPVSVKVNDRELESFAYDAPNAALNQETRDAIVAGVLDAWSRYGKDASGKPPAAVTVKSERAPVVVTIKEAQDEKPRAVALKYVEDIAAAMRAALPPATLKLLDDRYRRALIDNVNGFRRSDGLSALDKSRVQLAHPKLDLYVDQDSKHPMEQLGCTSCHDGSGQETNFVLAAHTPRPIWVDMKTGEPVLPAQMDASRAPAEHHGADLSNMLATVYSHDEIVPTRVADLHLEGSAPSEPGRDEARPSNESHSRAIPEAPTVPAAADQITPIPFTDPLTGREGRAVPQMRYWMDVYQRAENSPRGFELVYHEWDWPMRPFKYLQANCVRCHSNIYDIKDQAPRVFEGRSLFANLGCANCHQVDQIPAEDLPKTTGDIKLISSNGQRKVGTDLRNITAKLSPAFINSWIWAPKAFRPSTKMPHFFMLENNSSDNEIKRTRQEARAITEYLLRTANKSPAVPQIEIAPTMKGSPEKGKIIFNTIGCQGCHTNTNDLTGEKRPDGQLITLGEKWIVTDLVKTTKVPDAAAARKLFDSMSYNARQVYLTEHLAPDYVNEQRLYPDKTPRPVFQHHGPELSGVGAKLTAGRTPEQARQWLVNWLLQPRHYSEYTVMPSLRLNEQQALDLAEYLLAQKRTNAKKDDPWKADLVTPDTQKLIDLTSLFLRSKYTAQTALARADDDTELNALAIDALTTAINDEDAAKAEVAKMSRDDKRLVFLGKKLISNYGCMNCHAINGTESMSSPCANLSDWGQKSVDKLDYGYLEHEKLKSLPPHRAIPMVNGLSDHATHLLTANTAPATSQPVASLEHAAGLEDAARMSRDIEVAWPHVEHARSAWITQKLKNTRIFDRGKTLLDPNPRLDDPLGKPYDKLKMPTFYLNDAEVDAIVTFVLSNRDRLITQKLIARSGTEQSQRISEGRRLVQKYNCINCHVLAGNYPSVQQYFKLEEIATKAPPSLRGEGNKIQHTWLFNFLKNVEPLRPLIYMHDGIRMPSFPLTDAEGTAIAAYFAAESTHESEDLAQKMVPVVKYITDTRTAAMKPIVMSPAGARLSPSQAKAIVDACIAQSGAYISQQQYEKAIDPLVPAIQICDALATGSGAPRWPVENSTALRDAAKDLSQGKIPDKIPWPGDDWYLQPTLTTAAASLRDWALDKKQVNPLQLDPTKNSPAELSRRFRTILFTSDFVRELFDAPYPFVDSPRPELTDDRFKKGEQLFYSMQCLKCHVLGDPNQPGANKNPTAPNLNLAYRRLQRRWVRHWAQEPDIIQKGTPMPPFWTGLPIWDVNGQIWPKSQGGAPEQVRQVAYAFGTELDGDHGQATLLLDFLYAAGVRGYTGVQPTSQPTLPAPPPDFMPVKPATLPAALTTTRPAIAPSASAETKAQPAAVSVKGKIMLAGKPPEQAQIPVTSECAGVHPDPITEQIVVASAKGELANVVLSISGAPQGNVPSEPVVLDQQGCMYHPHVLAMMTGQQLLIRNSDPFMHNVHALSQVNPTFNFAQNNKDPGKPVDSPKTAETFHVKCDVHPWMSSYIAVFDHPYFAVSKEDGTFEIRGLPPGDYTLKAWHESLGEQEQKITVPPDKPAEVKLTFQSQ